MIPDEAAEQLRSLGVSRETSALLEKFVELLDQASLTQNLISPDSRSQVWQRHIIDSLQLFRLVPQCDGRWVDVGTGAGFPGLILALVSECRFVLVEPRRRRADFLRHAAEALGVAARVTVYHGKVETLQDQPANILSARAVAALPAIFAAAHHLARADTVWLLPKGRSAQQELAEARQTWQGDFELVPSMTDPDAAIVVARRVQRKANR